MAVHLHQAGLAVDVLYGNQFQDGFPDSVPVGCMAKIDTTVCKSEVKSLPYAGLSRLCLCPSNHALRGGAVIHPADLALLTGRNSGKSMAVNFAASLARPSISRESRNPNSIPL